jgi:hypothetical protein
MKKFNLVVTAFMIAALSVSCGGEDAAEKAMDDAATDFMDAMEEIDMSEEMEDAAAELMDAAEEMDMSEEESSDGSEWDELLDEYDAYMEDYVAVMKKAQADPTDMSILTESQELAQKGMKWAEKMTDAAAQLTPEQAARYQKIAGKAMKAMM